VNAVHQMLEHMSRQMERLRQILRLQKTRWAKAGILVNRTPTSWTGVLGGVPDSGKRELLLSNEAALRASAQYQAISGDDVEREIPRGRPDSGNYLGAPEQQRLELRGRRRWALANFPTVCLGGKSPLIDTVRRSGEQVRTEQEGDSRA